jgi:hypothetical protein
MNRQPASSSRRSAADYASLRAGYVLLLTLVVLLLAGLLTAGMARHSLRLVLESASAQDELQNRWGCWSLERTLLPGAAALLEARPQPRLTGDVRLGRQSLHFELTDESAKLNLNAVLRERGHAAVEQSARRRSPAELPVRLRLASFARATSSTETIDAWGQLFELGIGERAAEDAALAQVAEELTLWGDGKLHFARADPELVYELCAPVVGDEVVGELLALRSDPTPGNLNDLLDRLALRVEDRATLVRLLTTESTCFGLRVVSSHGAEFCAWDRSPRTRPRLVRLRW